MENAKRKAVEMEKELSSAKANLAAADKVLKERNQKLLNVNLQLEEERLAVAFCIKNKLGISVYLQMKLMVWQYARFISKHALFCGSHVLCSLLLQSDHVFPVHTYVSRCC